MTNEEKMDYMIQSLQLAKEEIEYAKKFNYDVAEYGVRNPNGTIIRESLRMVGRMANIVANDVMLSPYNRNVFRDKSDVSCGE